MTFKWFPESMWSGQDVTTGTEIKGFFNYEVDLSVWSFHNNSFSTQSQIVSINDIFSYKLIFGLCFDIEISLMVWDKKANI